MKRAFTLVEIMVVVAVMGLLMGIAAPAFWKIVKKAQNEQGISLVETLCREARETAIEKQQAMDLVLNETEEIVALTTAARVITAPDPFTGLMINTIEQTQLIGRAFLEVDLQIIEPEPDEFTQDEIRIRFYPNGTSEILALRVVGDGDAYLLILDPVTGRTKVINEEDLR